MMMENTAVADAVIVASQKALGLPDTTFRTEYDMMNALEANVERLQAAASMAPSREGVIRDLCDAWRARADQWKRNRQHNTLSSSVAEFAAAMAAQDEEPEPQQRSPQPKRRQRGKAGRQSKVSRDHDSSTVEVLPPPVESLPVVYQAPEPPPSDPAPEPPRPIVYTEVLRNPPELVGSSAVLREALESPATLQLLSGTAAAEIVFDYQAPGTAELSPARDAHRTPPSRHRSPRSSRSSTPRTSTPPPEAIRTSSLVEFRVEVLRSVLRAIVHIGMRWLEGSGAVAPSPVRLAPMPSLETVRDVLVNITSGRESKLPKLLRGQGSGNGAEVSSAENPVAGSSADDDDGMPPPGVAVTQEFVDEPHSSVVEVKEEGEPDDSSALSKKLVEEYERLRAEEDLRAAEGSIGGLQRRVPALTLAVVLPALREAPMAVLMCHGGAFAGGVFLAGTPLVHKSFERYVVRKKQGGKQSSQGAGTNSAGSQIRKLQETLWREDVKRLLDDWRSLLDICWCIAYVAPGPENRRVLFDFSTDWNPRPSAASVPPELLRFFHQSCGVFKPSGLTQSPIDLDDPRVFSAPLTTHKPSFAEVERIYAALCAVTVRRIYFGC